jgi:hypothetical protein
MKQPTMQVVQSQPPVAIRIVPVPIEREGIAATINNECDTRKDADLKIEVATDASEEAQENCHINWQGSEINWRYIEEELAELKKEVAAITNKDAQEIDSDWHVVKPKEVLTAIAELKQALRENKQALAENGKGPLSRLYDMAIGAAALTAAEIGIGVYYYRNEIRFVIEHRAELSVIWEAIQKLMT